MRVMKFGGSSVATPARITDVADIMLKSARSERTIVVVSAFQGVTNQLLECARLAESGDRSYQRLFRSLASRHHAALRQFRAARRRCHGNGCHF